MPTRAGMSRALLKLRALVQALTRALVQDVEGSKGPPLMGPVMNEVVGRDMVRVLGAQPDTGSVVQPQTSPLRVFAGHLQPLAPPQALDPLVVDRPAGGAQQGRDPPVAVTVHDHATISDHSPRPSRASRARRAATSTPAGHPAQHHCPVAPAFHILLHMARAAQQTLDGVGGGQRSRQPQRGGPHQLDS